MSYLLLFTDFEKYVRATGQDVRSFLYGSIYCPRQTWCREGRANYAIKDVGSAIIFSGAHWVDLLGI